MRYPYFLIVFFLISAGTMAQQITKSTGTSNSTFLWGSTDYARKTQLLYTPAALSNEQNGKISRIYFRYGTTGTNNPQVLGNLKIKLGQTINTTFNGSAFYPDLTTVLDSASYTIPAKEASDWFSIPVDTIFSYDATKTLIVQVSFQTSSVPNWGTLGTSNTPVRKIISDDTAATTGDGTSSTWQDFGFDVLGEVTSGSPAIVAQNELVLFPNPANDKIYFTFAGKHQNPLQFSVYNSKGQAVLKGTSEQKTTGINISTLAPACYWLEVTETGKKQRSPFIKQ